MDRGLSPPPTISVLLPVFNGAKYLRAAVESVLAQTFRDFEIVAIDDGSSDDSYRILSSFADSRIRTYRQENQGLAATLNRAIALSRGELLARQDQDDLSLPRRFEKQAAFLRANTDHAMVGTWSRIWVGSADSGRDHRHPTDNLSLSWDLLFDNPFVHSSLMLRRPFVEGLGGYSTDPARQPPEDYELWSRIAHVGRVANIGEFLQIYREVPQSMSRETRSPFLEKVIRISAENLAWASGRRSADAMCLSLATRVHLPERDVARWLARESAAEILEAAARRLGASPDGEARLLQLAAQRLENLYPQRAVSLRRRATQWALRALGKARP